MNERPKSILITGVTSGIGRCLAKRCLQEAHDVTGTIREQSQEASLEEETDTGLKLFACDLSKPLHLTYFKKWCHDKAFDYVVLNAGCADTGTFHELPDTSIDKILQTNLISNMHIVHALLPNALSRNTKIVFISSITAHIPGGVYATYATSKAALSHFYKCLRCEYPKLAFLCVELGAVHTSLHEKAGLKIKNKSRFKSPEVIANRLYTAMLHKKGLKTLSWDWTLMRKFALFADDGLVSILNMFK